MSLLTALCRLAPATASSRHLESLAGLRAALTSTTTTVLAVPAYCLLVGALLTGAVPDGHLGTATGLLALTAGLRLAVGIADLFSSA
jgi:hypothetical protein